MADEELDPDGPEQTLELRAVGVDPILDVLERELLGGPRTLTRLEVAERAEVDPVESERLWRSLGFSRASDDEVRFSYADVAALRSAMEWLDVGFIDAEQQEALARAMGRTYSRLAEWQTRLLADMVGSDEVVTPEMVQALAAMMLPKIEELQSYVWRRCLLAAMGRLLVRPEADQGTVVVVGFADIVGYTSTSRRLGQDELGNLVEHFERVSNDIVTEHEGRIIKTIGDEIMFVVDEPRAAGLIALELIERHDQDPDFPLIRVGLAYGPVLPRYGDVYGTVVNLASRLTTLARPGRALIDGALREKLRDDELFLVRRMRRAAVKGFDRVEPYRLKRPRPAEVTESNPISRAVAELRESLEETLDEVTPDVPNVVKRRRS